MDIDELINKIADFENEQDLNNLCDLLASKDLVHFHVLDEGQFGKESELVVTGENKQINVPFTKVDNNTYAVLYPSLKHINKIMAPGYRSFGIKGSKSFSLVSGLKGVNGLIVQGFDAWVAIPMSKVKEIAKSHA